MPKAFGKFPLKLDCVCDECNCFLGRTLEGPLARDSVEGVLRVFFGLRPKNGARRLGGKRLRMAVTEPSVWNGVRVFPVRDSTGKTCTVHPVPEVALRKKGDSEWKRFLESELNAEALKPYITEPEALVSGLPDEIPRLQEKLGELGIRLKGWEPENRSAFAPVFANSVCDDVILRAVAKISFNFLAYVEGAGFALESDFDCIRKYVRWGVAPPNAPVQILKPLIPSGGNALRPRHAVVLNWDIQNKGIACLVSLFGYLVYQVTLCENYPGAWRPLAAGRTFDVQTRIVSEMSGLGLAPFDAWALSFWGSSDRSATSPRLVFPGPPGVQSP